MAVYAYSKVAVYAALGGAVRPATMTRVLVTDTVTGDPVNVTQGTRTAPYLDTDANGVASFTAEHPGPLRLTTGATFMDVYSNELPGIALDAVTAAESAETAALAAQAAAEDAASLVGAPADSAMALTAGNPASAFRGALDDVYATQAQITAALDAQDTKVGAALAAVQDAMATTEDLIVTTTLAPLGTVWDNAADRSAPLLVAPFPLRIEQVSLLFWSGATVAVSDSSYWRVVLRTRRDSATIEDVAYRTTKATAEAPYPAGTAWTPRDAWTFDSEAFNADAATLAAGDVLYLATLPTGAPTTFNGLFATVRYRPL